MTTAPIVYVNTDGSGDYDCDGTDDDVQIQQALDYVNANEEFTTVYLRGANVYTIGSQLTVFADTTLTGDSTAEIKLVDEAGWGINVPLILIPTITNNVHIHGFTVNGNSGNQSVLLGASYYTQIFFTSGSEDCSVHNMRLEWGSNDAVYIKTATRFEFYNNVVYKAGHEGLMSYICEYVSVHDNDIYTRVNSGVRCTNSNHVEIYNNEIHSWHDTEGDSTGPGIELISADGYIIDDVVIRDNSIHTLEGSGIWMFADSASNIVNTDGVHIHHNLIYDVGKYWSDNGYSNCGITLGQWQGTIIENNVISDCGHAAIKTYRRGDLIEGATFETIVRNNAIITTTMVEQAGIWNYSSFDHTISSSYNCLYQHAGGNYLGTGITTTEDIYEDPLFADATNGDYHLKSLYGRWHDSEWVFDDASSPLIDAGMPSSEFSNEHERDGNRINIGRYGNTPEASLSMPYGSSIELTSNILSKLYINDTGIIKIDCVGALSAANTHYLSVQKPDNSIVVWNTSIIEDRYLQHLISTDDLDLAGPYSIQAYIERGGELKRGDTTSLTVYGVFK